MEILERHQQHDSAANSRIAMEEAFSGDRSPAADVQRRLAYRLPGSISEGIGGSLLASAEEVRTAHTRNKPIRRYGVYRSNGPVNEWDSIGSAHAEGAAKQRECRHEHCR
jgi:hypothetical protein